MARPTEYADRLDAIFYDVRNDIRKLHERIEEMDVETYTRKLDAMMTELRAIDTMRRTERKAIEDASLIIAHEEDGEPIFASEQEADYRAHEAACTGADGLF